ncbi:MAG: hypothetical protein M1822_006032 [Bathelium mastoideum]|nr:MAG: hypothetical protein M1822_006032 [Bathelium mastoideum]
MSTPTSGSKGRLFITGATGYIAGVIIELAIPEGYDVYGLSRTPEGDARLKALGATPVRGDLTTLDVLARESKAADVVMHLAFNHDFLTTDYNQILAIDAAAVNAMGEGLKGTEKPFIISSGSALVEPDPEGKETNEESELARKPIIERIKAEQNALRLKDEGVRVISIRLAPFVYGRGGKGFLTIMMRTAITSGESLYIESGAVRSSDVHVEDAARMYLLAAEKAKPGDVFNCTSSTNITYKELAEGIGKVCKVPVRSMSREESAIKFGPFLTPFFLLENRSSSQKAKVQLGWQPKGVDRYTDLTKGSYVAVAEQLRNDPSQKVAGL